MKLEMLVIVGLGVVLLRLWWRSKGRQWGRFWQRWKAHLPRCWRAKTPAACPHCQGKAGALSVARLQGEVRPYRVVKSRRGRPKRVKTAGYACPNKTCAYFGLQDEAVHALVGYGTDGKQAIQRFRCQACQAVMIGRKIPHNDQFKSSSTPVK